tara:strand:- start:583 stop:1164 length:582 start_codon:yes stop_codon:yes gene_type:complete
MSASNYRKDRWENLNEFRTLFESQKSSINDSGNDIFRMLEDQWSQAKTVINFSVEGEEIQYGRELIQYDSERTPIEVFMDMVLTGVYPPPEFLFLIAYIFDMYFRNEGEVNLEEIFFGRTKQRFGNFAARRAKSENDKYEAFENAYEAAKEIADFDFTLTRFAEVYLKSSENNEKDIETFLRGRRRWKKQADI